MALSKEDREALNDYFQDRELYDPSRESEQQVADMHPCMCGGGCAPGMCRGGMAMARGGPVKGYADGGEIDLSSPSLEDLPENFLGPSLSADTDTAHVPMNAPVPSIAAASPKPALLASPPVKPPEAGPQIDEESNASAGIGSDSAPAGAPSSSPMKSLSGDEWAQLVQALGQKPSVGQSAMKGLAALGDAIVQGVGRAGNPEFEKGIEESQESRRQALIDVLRAKYEAGFKGQELSQAAQRAAEEARHNKAGEQIGSEEASARLAEAKQGLQQNALEAMGRLSQAGGITGRVFGQPQSAAAAIDALASRAGLAPGAAKPLTAVNKQTGQRIVSVDGGKTWKPLQ